MYVSHRYKLIFLRSPKTASSSLSEFFIKNIPDPSAIYTPVEDSNIRGNLDGNIIKKYKKDFKYYHLTIEDLIKENIITEHQARTYKVISVLRDPVDRQKSFLYFYAKWKARGKPVDLALYKRLAPNGTFRDEPNSSLVQANFSKLGNEYIGEYWLYENINKRISNLMQELSLVITYPLPNHKSDFRKNKSNEIVFDSYCLEQLKTVFKKDFELYNELKGI